MANKGSFGSPGRKGGRPQGIPNKLTADVKAAILEAFENAGGASYLLTVAQSSPQVFCALLGKVMPTQVSMTDADGGPAEITVRFIKADG